MPLVLVLGYKELCVVYILGVCDLLKNYSCCKEPKFQFGMVLQYWSLSWVEKIVSLDMDFECEDGF